MRWYLWRAERIRWKALSRGLNMIIRGVDRAEVTALLEREEHRARRLEDRVAS